jgi:mercuric ion transport protein
MNDAVQADGSRKGLIATGGVIAAILASSCCIVPLLLLTLGVSGAWMGNLTALAPYQYYFIAATLVFLAAGFWYVYWKPKKTCEEGSYCASPASDRVIKIALWFATALIALALGFNFILPFFI